jgi:uncharacterized protein
MATPIVGSHAQPGSPLIAPAWHTLLVLLLVFVPSALSARSHSLSPLGSSHGHVANYITVIVWEWLLLVLVWFGVHLRGVRLADLISGRWPTWGSVVRDLGIALVFLIVCNVVLALISRLLKAAPNGAIRSVFPHGRTEVALYLLLTLTAGFCEEAIFRGYLQRQFAAIGRSTAAGVVIQGIAFGAAHGYQGPKFMFIIAVYGCLFGLLAVWRHSLRPGMIAHFLQDAAVGLVAGRFLK